MKPSEEEIENAIGLSFRALEEFVDGLEAPLGRWKNLLTD